MNHTLNKMRNKARNLLTSEEDEKKAENAEKKRKIERNTIQAKMRKRGREKLKAEN